MGGFGAVEIEEIPGEGLMFGVSGGALGHLPYRHFPKKVIAAIIKAKMSLESIQLTRCRICSV